MVFGGRELIPAAFLFYIGAFFHHLSKNQPATGDRIIMITENVNDDIDISVARCSEGNIS